MTAGAIHLAPGQTLSGPIGPAKLSLTSFALVLHVVMTPTLAVIPKTLIRYHSGDDASSAKVFELVLSDSNDITLNVSNESVAIPCEIARRYFNRFVMLEAWSFRDQEMFNIGLRLENEVEQSILIPGFEPLSMGFVTLGGEGAEFMLKEKLLLSGPLSRPDRLGCLQYFRQKREAE